MQKDNMCYLTLVINVFLRVASIAVILGMAAGKWEGAGDFAVNQFIVCMVVTAISNLIALNALSNEKARRQKKRMYMKKITEHFNVWEEPYRQAHEWLLDDERHLLKKDEDYDMPENPITEWPNKWETYNRYMEELKANMLAHTRQMRLENADPNEWRKNHPKKSGDEDNQAEESYRYDIEFVDG